MDVNKLSANVKLRPTQVSSKVRAVNSRDYSVSRKNDSTYQSRFFSSYMNRLSCPTRQAFYRQKSLEEREKRKKTATINVKYQNSSQTTHLRPRRVDDGSEEIPSNVVKSKSLIHGILHNPINQNYAEETAPNESGQQLKRPKKIHPITGPKDGGYGSKYGGRGPYSGPVSTNVSHKSLSSRNKSMLRSMRPPKQSIRKPPMRQPPRSGLKKPIVARSSITNLNTFAGVDSRRPNPNLNERRNAKALYCRKCLVRDNYSETLSERLKYGKFGRNINRNSSDRKFTQYFSGQTPSENHRQHRRALTNRFATARLPPSRIMYPRVMPQLPASRYPVCRRAVPPPPRHGVYSQPPIFIFQSMDRKGQRRLTLSEIMHIDIKPYKMRPPKSPNRTISPSLTNPTPRLWQNHPSSNFKRSTKEFSPRNMYTHSSRMLQPSLCLKNTVSCRNLNSRNTTRSLSHHKCLSPTLPQTEV